MSGAGRRARVVALFAEQGPGRERLCDLCLTQLPQLSGAGVVVMTTLPARAAVCLSGPLSVRVEDLQFTLGEGPCVDAFASGQPVITPDLAGAASGERWPAFAPAAAAAGARALFAFPLRIGTIRVGVLDLRRDRPGPLTDDEFADALVLADVVTQLLLMDSHYPGPDGELEFGLDHRAVVHQATGMIMVQLQVSIVEAFVRLRAYCYADSRALDEVAQDVVERRLRFDEMTG